MSCYGYVHLSLSCSPALGSPQGMFLPCASSTCGALKSKSLPPSLSWQPVSQARHCSMWARKVPIFSPWISFHFPFPMSYYLLGNTLAVEVLFPFHSCMSYKGSMTSFGYNISRSREIRGRCWISSKRGHKFPQNISCSGDSVRSLKEFRHNTRLLVSKYEDKVRMAAERKRHCENIVLSAAKEQERLQAVDNISEADVKSCKDTSTWRFVSHFSICNYELMNLYSLLSWIVPNLVLTTLHSRFNMSWELFVQIGPVLVSLLSNCRNWWWKLNLWGSNKTKGALAWPNWPKTSIAWTPQFCNKFHRMFWWFFFLPLIVLVDLPYQQKLNRNFLQISLLFLEKKHDLHHQLSKCHFPCRCRWTFGLQGTLSSQRVPPFTSHRCCFCLSSTNCQARIIHLATFQSTRGGLKGYC